MPHADWGPYQKEFKINISRGAHYFSDGLDVNASEPFDMPAMESSYVYMSYPPKDAPPAQQGKRLSWSTFSFRGKVTIFVQKLNRPELTQQGCTIRPSMLKLHCAPVPESAGLGAGIVSVVLDSDALGQLKSCGPSTKPTSACWGAKLSIEFDGEDAKDAKDVHSSAVGGSRSGTLGASPSNQLMVFADPPEEAPFTAASCIAPSCIYYGVGLHDLGTT
jgi:hypothetical protein